MKGKLNLFQASILRWRALHPYNAVHVVCVAQAIDPVRLEAALRGQLQDLGLTGLELDARRQRYEWTGGPASVAVRVIPAAGEAIAAVCREIERELNAGFAREGRIDPFRFFAIDNGAEFYLGLAYDHFVAGGDSIVVLLQGMVDRYLNGTVQETLAGVAARRYGPTYAHLLRHQLFACARALLSLPRLAANCHHAFRPRYAAPQDGYNALAFVRIEAADRARLDACATAWEMTSHDLLVAILLKGLAPLTVRRMESSKRNEIAIGSIVNIRRDFGPEASDALAPYLASFRVSHPVPDDLSVRDLAAAVSGQSGPAKREKRYLQTVIAMNFTAVAWRFMSTPQRQRFYAKHFALCAGTTPLRIDALWARGGTRVPRLDYIRAVPTGPLAPMVFAFTTVGDVINVGISFRTTVFRRDAVDRVATAMLESIRTL